MGRRLSSGGAGYVPLFGQSKWNQTMEREYTAFEEQLGEFKKLHDEGKIRCPFSPAQASSWQRWTRRRTAFDTWNAFLGGLEKEKFVDECSRRWFSCPLQVPWRFQREPVWRDEVLPGGRKARSP